MAKAPLAPFHAARDGHATTSVSGFVLMHEQQPVVVTSAAIVLPLLRQQRRQGPHAGLPGTTHADLVAGTTLTALPCPAALPDSSESSSTSSCSAQNLVQLRLSGVVELPGVRHALAQLLSAPSTAGPSGWSLGWLLHRGGPQQQQQQHAAQLAPPPWRSSAGSTTGGGSGGGSTSSSPFVAAASSRAMLLEAACHAAVLLPATAEGAQALASIAQPWPSSCDGAAAVRQGQPLAAVGAPFGALSPLHFGGFVAGGIVAATVPAATSGSSTGCGAAALLLSDVRCSPGMEGGPVFALGGMPSGADELAAQQQRQRQRLAGMLLPPLKSAEAQVELALVAPAAAVAAAVEAALPTGRGHAHLAAAAAGAVPPQARVDDAAGLPPALRGVVAVASSSGWATGVLISSAGHILTNAHLLEPPVSAVQHGLLPAADAADAAAAAAVGAEAREHPPVRVLLPGGSGSSGGSWALADVLHVFSGPLDLAVLQLQQPARQGAQQQEQPGRRPAWQPLVLAGGQPRPGQRVRVAGFPAFHPRGGVLGPLLTAGTLAKVVRAPTSGRPAMLLTTAAVHSGASGGAVVDADTGGWLGLVTSNAKHSGAKHATQQRATVLPHLNFSIPADQLLPVVAAAQAAAAAPPGEQPAAAAAALAVWQALDRATAADGELQRVWQLDRQRQRQQPAAKQQQGSSPGAFGGAVPPAKLQQLLQSLQQQQQQQQQPRAKL
ncbi:glyoxysomal processing glyoxysomal [Micractinium conductrix]|uniref:Glyoxysomal processing glyoxysomal n=1 Tax=Micractinium conductrix TaxID=554055 RepID=A0A2P6VRN2_9CHLO|nr:glyoxysomal processing glyoxysomal [Micractinium conductrix]|eukprot:PSC76730.1 glyoxysomal processing glyoxysomal [Micractinium conductrix]